jgi:hypothetical protein
MALSRAFRFFPTLPAAACLALALGACLDNTLPVEPATESPNGTVADDTPAGGRQDKIVPFDSMSLRDRFDSSRRAMRGLEARSGGSYAYLRVRFAGWPSGPDTTRVGFAAGRAILREAWYTVALHRRANPYPASHHRAGALPRNRGRRRPSARRAGLAPGFALCAMRRHAPARLQPRFPLFGRARSCSARVRPGPGLLLRELLPPGYRAGIRGLEHTAMRGSYGAVAVSNLRKAS